MQDKEFDQFFRDHFADAEITPSAGLWEAIETRIEPKRSRSFPIYWMAAASVAVAIIGALFYQKPEKIRLYKEEHSSLSAHAGGTAAPTKVVSVATIEGENQKEPTLLAAGQRPVVRTLKSEKRVVPTEEKNNSGGVQPERYIAHLPIKPSEAKPLELVKTEDLIDETPIVYAALNDQVTETADEVTSPKKGIRNVGDLVNYVVDKVDKREQKLIRFNTDDDDNSSIVAINIGFLKFNPKKNRY